MDLKTKLNTEIRSEKEALIVAVVPFILSAIALFLYSTNHMVYFGLMMWYIGFFTTEYSTGGIRVNGYRIV